MKRTIGIVAEGITDYLVLKAVIDKITGEENRYRMIQPEPDMCGRYGNGWKGVWKWCKDTPSLEMLANGILPKIDFFVIQMDGDVIRKEKEAHCMCASTVCPQNKDQFPLYCEKIKNHDCPVVLPCKSHRNNDILDTISHGRHILENLLCPGDLEYTVITIPCDSTDAWIVAAYVQIENAERIEDPWQNMIARGKYYHDVRVRGDKKSQRTYVEFIPTLIENWHIVTEICVSARLLHEDILHNT